MNGKSFSIRMGIKINPFENKKDQIPEEFKDLAKDFAEKGFITTSSENLIKSSYRFFTLDDFWCGLLKNVEMMQTSMPKYDLERFGAPKASPRQSGVMIVMAHLLTKWLQH